MSSEEAATAQEDTRSALKGQPIPNLFHTLRIESHGQFGSTDYGDLLVANDDLHSFGKFLV